MLDEQNMASTKDGPQALLQKSFLVKKTSREKPL